MYAEMFEKAQEGSYDMVMCDVRIIYVEEDRTTVVSSYPNREIDLADYIANGSNITYSVNKLFHRSIWEENRYEKMLFEDIALIPSLVTRYPAIGYVPKPFYNYYRRANTISTTFVGEMVGYHPILPKFPRPQRSRLSGRGGLQHRQTAVLEHDPVPGAFSGRFHSAAAGI